MKDKAEGAARGSSAPRRPFCGQQTCEECPWRTDVPVGRFPRERFVALAETVEQGFNPLFACHKTPDGGERACVGYLLVDGMNNFRVRLSAIRGEFDPGELRATGPLYPSFAAMARANGVRGRRR